VRHRPAREIAAHAQRFSFASPQSEAALGFKNFGIFMMAK
jgi:hypothetical protein